MNRLVTTEQLIKLAEVQRELKMRGGDKLQGYDTGYQVGNVVKAGALGKLEVLVDIVQREDGYVRYYGVEINKQGEVCDSGAGYRERRYDDLDDFELVAPDIITYRTNYGANALRRKEIEEQIAKLQNELNTLKGAN